MSRKFLLTVLRVEHFLVPDASTRLLLFLEKKILYFGLAALRKNLVLSDLNEEDLETLRRGPYQVRPRRYKYRRLQFTISGALPGQRRFVNYSSFVC